MEKTGVVIYHLWSNLIISALMAIYTYFDYGFANSGRPLSQIAPLAAAFGFLIIAFFFLLIISNGIVLFYYIVKKINQNYLAGTLLFVLPLLQYILIRYSWMPYQNSAIPRIIFYVISFILSLYFLWKD
jgi:hypothetical protein